jgi:chemotaxis protein CheD
MSTIIVGMADLNVTKSTGTLITYGLGSCIGIALYDPINKVAGLAHIMLPDSTKIQSNSNTAKFADTAIEKLLKDMEKLGAKRAVLKAKIAGGAQMFAFNSTNESLRIGERNIEATLHHLRAYRIPVVANETGKDYGRTVELHSDDGRLVIKTVGHGTKIV